MVVDVDIIVNCAVEGTKYYDIKYIGNNKQLDSKHRNSSSKGVEKIKPA